MALYKVYIDESGTKEYALTPDLYDDPKSGVTRYFTFGAVLIEVGEISSFCDKIDRLKQHYLNSTDFEIKSNWLRIPKERRSRYIEPYSIDDEALTAFVESVYDAICESKLMCLAAVVDKKEVEVNYSNPHYAPALAYEFLMQRVVQEVRAPDEVSITIDDMTGATPKGNQYKKNLRNHHAQLRKNGSRFCRDIDFSCIRGSCKFVNSKKSNPIQIADLVAYNVLRQFKEYGDEWEDEDQGQLTVYPYLRRIIGKFRQGPQSRIQGFGIVKFPLKKRVAWRIVRKS